MSFLSKLFGSSTIASSQEQHVLHNMLDENKNNIVGSLLTEGAYKTVRNQYLDTEQCYTIIRYLAAYDIPCIWDDGSPPTDRQIRYANSLLSEVPDEHMQDEWTDHDWLNSRTKFQMSGFIDRLIAAIEDDGKLRI